MPSKPSPITMDAVYAAPGYLFRRMQQIAVALFVEECRAFDLTPVQYASLVAIHTHPGIDATRLSAVIAFDRSTLDFVDVHLYPAWGISMAQQAVNFGIDQPVSKPLVMGEFGELKARSATIEQAVALRDVLRTIAGQAGELARSLKQQKQQAHIA